MYTEQSHIAGDSAVDAQHCKRCGKTIDRKPKQYLPGVRVAVLFCTASRAFTSYQVHNRTPETPAICESPEADEAVRMGEQFHHKI